MEEFLRNHESKLDLPPTSGEETIFEYMVGDKGDWEHWRNRFESILIKFFNLVK